MTGSPGLIPTWTDKQPRTFAAAEAVLDFLWANYRYERDAATYSRADWWTGALDQLRDTGFVLDDCDGFGRLGLTLMRFLGAFAAEDCFECVVDVERGDKQPYDHHVGAVVIRHAATARRKLYYFHCWANGLRGEFELEDGRYLLPDGTRAGSMTIKGHRRLDKSNRGWRTGPPHV